MSPDQRTELFDAHKKAVEAFAEHPANAQRDYWAAEAQTAWQRIAELSHENERLRRQIQSHRDRDTIHGLGEILPP